MVGGTLAVEAYNRSDGERHAMLAKYAALSSACH